MTTSRPAWTLLDLLSPGRLAPYRLAAGGDLSQALLLYEWNNQVSAGFYESLHYLEIGLRNAIDVQLTDWCQGAGGALPWYRDPVVPLSGQSRRLVGEACQRALVPGQPEAHGKVIAELTFGFWWALTAGPYNRTLWRPCLQHAFDGNVRRERLHTALDELRKLRNRVAHHEPLHRRNLATDLALLLDTAGRISSTLEAHIQASTRVPDLLARRPGLAPAALPGP